MKKASPTAHMLLLLAVCGLIVSALLALPNTGESIQTAIIGALALLVGKVGTIIDFEYGNSKKGESDE